MPDSILNEMEFEQRLNEMKDRELLEFTARKTFSISILVNKHEKQIKVLENRDRKTIGLSGGLGGIIGGALITVFNYFIGRN